MPTTKIPYHQTGYFSALMCDYLSKEGATKTFYHRYPALDQFKSQLEEKQASFSMEQRKVLVEELEQQYTSLDTSEATQNNIASLATENTFTITTGHQLNLFTGPLYFLYKIFSVINLAERLCEVYPNQHFVPVYWMATEDHDFDEINYFNLHGKKIAWNRKSSGAVGSLSNEGLDEVLSVLKTEFGASEQGKRLTQLFKAAYTKHDTLAAATRYLGNELFKKYGLVVIDGDSKVLKNAFIPYAQLELSENRSFHEVTKTTQHLVNAGYGEQVHPREINLFYLKDGLRERIIEQEGRFIVNDTKISFSSEEIEAELQAHPERFSPNALLRPLYQEVILPNLCYTGGGGELAYWFQLKDYFSSVEVSFPILLLRNSALLVARKYSEKLKKLNVSVADLFQKQHELISAHTKIVSEIKIDFSVQKEHLKQQFTDLYEIAKQTDASFAGAVAAQEKKQINGLAHLEMRLLRAQKRKLADQLDRLTAIQDALFPGKSLQERNTNFSEFYLEYGDDLLSQLKQNLDPLALEFTVLEL